MFSWRLGVYIHEYAHKIDHIVVAPSFFRESLIIFDIFTGLINTGTWV